MGNGDLTGVVKALDVLRSNTPGLRPSVEAHDNMVKRERVHGGCLGAIRRRRPR